MSQGFEGAVGRPAYTAAQAADAVAVEEVIGLEKEASASKKVLIENKFQDNTEEYLLSPVCYGCL